MTLLPGQPFDAFDPFDVLDLLLGGWLLSKPAASRCYMFELAAQTVFNSVRKFCILSIQPSR